MYSVRDYGSMIADRVRMDAFTRALALVVRPGSLVLDLGTGAGIFALVACRLGARRVYAIEPNSIIQAAREIAAANNFGDRITFLEQRSEEVRLPERVDVIVADVRGVLPCLDGGVHAVIDARQRFLAPGGAMIGRRDTVWVALVESPELYGSHFSGWDDRTLGFDQLAARRIVANTWSKGRVDAGQLLTDAWCCATLDYETVTSSDLHAEISWTPSRRGTAHGLVAWFDAELADGVGFSNAPGKPELVYGSAFFPWIEPVPLEAGDRVTVTLEGRLQGGDRYIWTWDSRVDRPGRPPVEFRQTTLLSDVVSPTAMKRRALQYKPVLGEEGQIDRFVLSAMNGRASIGTIARRMRARYPRRFASLRDAVTRAGDLSARFSRERRDREQPPTAAQKRV
jgi:protein arginine N-methyltransferase 1